MYSSFHPLRAAIRRTLVDSLRLKKKDNEKNSLSIIQKTKTKRNCVPVRKRCCRAMLKITGIHIKSAPLFIYSILSSYMYFVNIKRHFFLYNFSKSYSKTTPLYNVYKYFFTLHNNLYLMYKVAVWLLTHSKNRCIIRNIIKSQSQWRVWKNYLSDTLFLLAAGLNGILPHNIYKVYNARVCYPIKG